MAAIGHAGCSDGKDGGGLEDDESPAGGDSNTGSTGANGSGDTDSNAGGTSSGDNGGQTNASGSGTTDGTGDGSSAGMGNGMNGNGDGGVVPLEPVAEGDWDAAVEVPEALVGAAFVEKHNSFRVLYPPIFADIYSLLEDLDLLGGERTRVFGQLVRDTSGNLEVRYGAMDLTGSAGNWTGSFQDTFTENTFRIAPSVDDPLLYVSQPFDYLLSMQVTLNAIIFQQTFHVNLYTVQAQWTARFDDAFQNIEEGTLTSLLLRDEAKAASIQGAELFCTELCTIPDAADPQAEQARVRSLCAPANQPYPVSLADLLDCREHAVDSDADSNGELESYQVRLRFEGERITAQ